MPDPDLRPAGPFRPDLRPLPGPEALTGPPEFARLFPASQGSLYGLSPHGTMATFRRPVPRTPDAGAVAGGGRRASGGGRADGGAVGDARGRGDTGRPGSMSPSARTAMRGGTSTGSRTTGRRAVSVIGFIGSVFSPWYAWSGRRDPANHCCLNVVTYGPGGRFTMTDRGRPRCGKAPTCCEIGPSRMTWRGTGW